MGSICSAYVVWRETCLGCIQGPCSVMSDSSEAPSMTGEVLLIATAKPGPRFDGGSHFRYAELEA